MLKKIKLISAILLSLAIASCSEAQDVSAKEKTVASQNSFVKNVTPKEFQNLIKSEGNLLDVRTPEEYAEGHLNNAQNINVFDADFTEQVSKLNKTKPAYLYCKSGGRSGRAMKKMKKLGFTKLYNLTGGYSEWISKGFASEK